MTTTNQYQKGLFTWIVTVATAALVLGGCITEDFSSQRTARQAARSSAPDEPSQASYKCSDCKDRGWDREYAGRTIPGPCLYCNQAGLHGTRTADERSDHTSTGHSSQVDIEAKYVLMHGNKHLCTVLRDITETVELRVWQKTDEVEVPFPLRECKPRRILKDVWINQELQPGAQIRAVLRDRRGRLLGDTGWIRVDDLPMEPEFRHTYQ